MNENRPPKRQHPVLEGDAAKLLGPFRLKMKDIPEKVLYLSDNALHLPEKLTSKQIRQIAVAAREHDKSGFSLGDLLVWLKGHPEAPYTYYDLVQALLYIGLKRRTIYNYQNLSNTFAPNDRVPGLSRPCHNAVRLRGLPNHERQRLLRKALKNGWTDTKVGREARIRKDELAMPANTDGEAANRSLIVRRLMRFSLEKARPHFTRAIRLLSKSRFSAKDATSLNREFTALLRKFADAKELLVHSPTP